MNTVYVHSFTVSLLQEALRFTSSTKPSLPTVPQRNSISKHISSPDLTLQPCAQQESATQFTVQTVRLLRRRRHAFPQHQSNIRPDTVCDRLVFEIVHFRSTLVERLAERQDRVDVRGQHLVALAAGQVAQLNALVAARVAVTLARGDE
jgi:hypothetical protein